MYVYVYIIFNNNLLLVKMKWIKLKTSIVVFNTSSTTVYMKLNKSCFVYFYFWLFFSIRNYFMLSPPRNKFWLLLTAL